MKTYIIDGQNVKAKTFWEAYAEHFGITIAKAIANRSHPATKQDCIGFFVESTGCQPSEAEIKVMSPCTDEQVELFFRG